MPSYMTSYEVLRATKPVNVCFDVGGIVGHVAAEVANVEVVIVSGKDADRMGAHYLQEMADEMRKPVIVSGDTDHHGNSIFHPQGGSTGVTWKGGA